MTPSNVELGQVCFSPNTIHHYDCPDYVVALLRDIARKSKTKEVFLDIITSKSNYFRNRDKENVLDNPKDMMKKFAAETIKPYVDTFLLSKETKEAEKFGYLNILSKGYYPTKSINSFQIPFYGMLSKTKKNESTQKEEVTYSDLTVKNVQDFLDRVGQTGVWDEEAQQLYAEWSSGGVKYQLWAETRESIMIKLNVMRAKELAGVAVWCLGSETPDVWEAISAYLNS